MSEAILTLNAGSSSLKVALFPHLEGAAIASGLVDQIGPGGVIKLKLSDGTPIDVTGADLTSHLASIRTVIDGLKAVFPGLALGAIGHRVVHGGDQFDSPVLVDEHILQSLEEYVPFAPLHQPHNLAGIRAATEAFPSVPQIACFDTAYHRKHPWVNDTFALPRSFYDEGVRRYGFHGLSYEYVAGELMRTAPQLAQGRVVVAHLGNGASMCAIHAGQSVASTMGFSALDGLPMGTRCGQLDPGVLLYLMTHKGMTPHSISDLLYKQSGLLGLSGLSNDMRDLEANASPEAAQAIDYFVFRCQREVGAMAAAMGGIDALVFCGGIGEHSKTVRARICERLGWMGIEIDHARNADHSTIVSSDVARTTVMIVPTNEEWVIAAGARSVMGMDQEKELA